MKGGREKEKTGLSGRLTTGHPPGYCRRPLNIPHFSLCAPNTVVKEK